MFTDSYSRVLTYLRVQFSIVNLLTDNRQKMTAKHRSANSSLEGSCGADKKGLRAGCGTPVIGYTESYCIVRFRCSFYRQFDSYINIRFILI